MGHDHFCARPLRAPLRSRWQCSCQRFRRQRSCASCSAAWSADVCSLLGESLEGRWSSCGYQPSQWGPGRIDEEPPEFGEDQSGRLSPTPFSTFFFFFLFVPAARWECAEIEYRRGQSSRLTWQMESLKKKK